MLTHNHEKPHSFVCKQKLLHHLSNPKEEGQLGNLSCPAKAFDLPDIDTTFKNSRQNPREACQEQSILNQ